MRLISRKEARGQGLTRYFTGKPCKYGHVAERRCSDRQCTVCDLHRVRAKVRKDRREKTPYYQRTRSKLYKLKTRNRRTVPQHMIRSRVSRRIRSALGGAVCKAEDSMALTGCSIGFLKAHLEAQFQPGMTWENHGQWHIDHIRPCASFDLTDPAQQRECFHYTNLQPLWAADNIAKSDKWDGSTTGDSPAIENPAGN